VQQRMAQPISLALKRMTSVESTSISERDFSSLWKTCCVRNSLKVRGLPL
jgi:hypothetical protein